MSESSDMEKNLQRLIVLNPLFELGLSKSVVPKQDIEISYSAAASEMRNICQSQLRAVFVTRSFILCVDEKVKGEMQCTRLKCGRCWFKEKPQQQ